MKSTSEKLFLVGVVVLTMITCTSYEDKLRNADSFNSISTHNSGIEGQVLRGPIHGGPVYVGEVDEEGFSALFYVNNDQGKLVTSFQSDQNGNYHVALSPGVYNIVPNATAPLMNATGQVKQVTVEKDKTSIDTLHFDTGLR